MDVHLLAGGDRCLDISLGGNYAGANQAQRRGAEIYIFAPCKENA